MSLTWDSLASSSLVSFRRQQGPEHPAQCCPRDNHAASAPARKRSRWHPSSGRPHNTQPRELSSVLANTSRKWPRVVTWKALDRRSAQSQAGPVAASRGSRGWGELGGESRAPKEQKRASTKEGHPLLSPAAAHPMGCPLPSVRAVNEMQRQDEDEESETGHAGPRPSGSGWTEAMASL